MRSALLDFWFGSTFAAQTGLRNFASLAGFAGDPRGAGPRPRRNPRSSRRHRSRGPGRPAPAPTTPHQRPQSQIPALALRQKRPLPAERSTPITGLAIIINDTEPNDTTRQSKGLTTALGP